MKRTFDRLVSFDEKSRQFPIMALIGAKPRRSYTWSCYARLNQGSEGACCGFGVSHEAAARPVVVPNIFNETAIALYKRAKQIDEWPGEDYSGSSVRAAVKAAVEKGWYSEYRWCFSESDLALAVGYKGPVILGTNWYTGMSETDSNGLIKVTGAVEGGHCYMIDQYIKKKHLYGILNSWGTEWGINGRCYISEDDMAQLLDEQGEACVPVKRLKGEKYETIC